MRKWQYKLREFIKFGHAEEAELNKLGLEGWELFFITPRGDNYELAFRREIPEPPTLGNHPENDPDYFLKMASQANE